MGNLHINLNVYSLAISAEMGKLVGEMGGEACTLGDNNSAMGDK